MAPDAEIQNDSPFLQSRSMKTCRHPTRRVVRHLVGLVASGRTDAGVHAAGHVSSFGTTCELEGDEFRHAIGSRLPTDVSLVALREVHPEFHATRSAVSKLYRYRIHNAPGAAGREGDAGSNLPFDACAAAYLWGVRLKERWTGPWSPAVIPCRGGSRGWNLFPSRPANRQWGFFQPSTGHPGIVWTHSSV